MNRLQSMAAPSQLCIFPTVRPSTIQEYSVVFISNGKVEFSLTLQDRINHVKILQFRKTPILVKGAQYHGQLLFVMDQLLNWSMFGFAVGNGSYQNRMREVHSCRQHSSLFDYVSEVTHKSRRQMKSFVDLIKDDDMWVLHIQLSMCQQWISVLTMRETSNGIQFDSHKRDISSSLLFYGTWADRQLVMSKTYERCLVDKSVLIDPQQYVTRLNVYRTDGYSVYMLIVNRHTQETHIGSIILCSIDQPIDIFMTTDCRQIVVFSKQTMIVYDMESQQSQSYKCGCLFVDPCQDDYRFIEVGSGCLVQVNTKGVRTILRKDLKGLVQVLQTDKEKYGVDESGSVVVVGAHVVYQNDTVRILQAVSISDRFGSTLRILKKTGETTEVQYVSSQPHFHTLLRMKHDMVVESFWHLGNTMVVSSPLMGTCFIQHTIDNGKLRIQNADKYRDYEQKEETLYIGMLDDTLVQVTQTTICVQKGNSVSRMDMSGVFDGLTVTIDFALAVGKFLILVVCQQLYLLTLRKDKLELLFIYCMDAEVENISGSLDTLLVKLHGRNTIDVYSINKNEETLDIRQNIDCIDQLVIRKMHTMAVTVGGQQYALCLVVRMYDYPLIILYNQKQLNHMQMTMLPIHMAMQLIQVRTDDNEKYTLLAADVFLYIPRIFTNKDMVVQCMKCQQTITHARVVAASVVGGLLLRMTASEYVLSQERQGVASDILVLDRMHMEMTSIGNMTQLTIRCRSEETASMRQENYSKIHTVEVYKTRLTNRVGRLQLNGILTDHKMLNNSIVILYGIDEIWLCRLVLDQQQLTFSVFSKFSYVNDAYSQFQHKIPRSDLEQSLLMQEFRQKHPIVDVGSLDLSKSFTQADNYIFILFQKIVLILQLDRLVIKIHQHIHLQQPIICILDNYQHGSAFLRGNNYIYILERCQDKFHIRKSLELDDAVVFATQLANWTHRTRKFNMRDSEPIAQENSLLLVKEFGQLEIHTTDRNGESRTAQTYL